MRYAIAAWRRKDEQGTAFLLAMVALVVLLILGSSFIQSAIQSLATAHHEKKQNEALDLAEAGVDHAMVTLYEGYDNVDADLSSTGRHDGTLTTANGSAAYTITGPYQGLADTVLIDSQATTNTQQQGRLRVVAAYMRDVSAVFRGAVFSDSPLVLNGAGTVVGDSSGQGGSIYANGDITFKGTSFTMATDGMIFTTGTTNWVPTEVPAGNVFQNIAPIPMPVIDLAYYRSIATQVYSGKVKFNSSDLTGISGVIFVDGDLSLSGSYSGNAIIVASGAVSITGNVEAGDTSTDSLVVMSPVSVKIAGNARVEGLVYAHSVIDDGSITASGSVEIVGALVADVVRTNGGINITYKDVWSSLPLPGTGKKQWAQISWDQVR
jgi:hypothetical protein